MRYYTGQTVFEAGLERIGFIFDEFDNVIVNFSGGKDSTVVLELALMVATKRKRLPLKVLFLDQEAEYQSAIEYIRDIMTDPRIEPMWMQIPFKLFNATANKGHWLNCWEVGGEWMRPKESYAYTENIYGTDRFAELFGAITRKLYPTQTCAKIGGVRTEESPSRWMGLTHHATYKWATWGRIEDKKLGHYTFYPVYDWSYTDIWKAIHSNGWRYCRLYDMMYQKGVAVQNMRVSNLHHETAIQNLFILQEFEPDNWISLTKRLEGVNTAGMMGKENYFPKELPYMFRDWGEYRDYLVENLLEEGIRQTFRDKFKWMDEKYKEILGQASYYKACMGTIMANDYHWTKLSNWESQPMISSYRRYLSTGEKSRHGNNQVIDYYIEHYGEVEPAPCK